MKIRRIRIWLSRGWYRTLYSVSLLLLPLFIHGSSLPKQRSVVQDSYSEDLDFNNDADKSDQDSVYAVVDNWPSFPGGTQELQKYLKENIVYPADALREGVQGRVIVSFIVEKDGTLTNTVAVKKVYPSIDSEAFRIVSRMPKWIPATNKGQLCRVRYSIPIDFRNNTTSGVDVHDFIEIMSSTEDAVLYGPELFGLIGTAITNEESKWDSVSYPLVVLDGKIIEVDEDKLSSFKFGKEYTDAHLVSELLGIRQSQIKAVRWDGVAIEKWGAKGAKGALEILSPKYYRKQLKAGRINEHYIVVR